MGLRAGTDGFGVQKFSCSYQDRKPDRPAHSQPLVHTQDSIHRQSVTICVCYPGCPLRNKKNTEEEDDAPAIAAPPPPNPPTTSTMAAAATSSLFSFLPYLFLWLFLSPFASSSTIISVSFFKRPIPETTQSLLSSPNLFLLICCQVFLLFQKYPSASPNAFKMMMIKIFLAFFQCSKYMSDQHKGAFSQLVVEAR